MKTLGLICVMAVAPLLRADGLADLRASLAKLGAKEAVRATVSLDTTSRSDEDEPVQAGRITFDAELGPEGLRVTYAPAVLERSHQEARAAAADPEKPTPTRTAMRQIDAEGLMELLDAGGSLARRLDTAKLLKDQRITSNGRPLRQLTFSLKPPLSKSDAKKIKAFELVLVVNLGADGIPVSAEMRQHVKAKFLLVSFQQEQSESWTFGRAGDRLVALRSQNRSSGSGLGQKFESSTSTALALK